MEQSKGFGLILRVSKKILAERKVVATLLALSCIAIGFDIGVPMIMQRVVDALVKSRVSGKTLPFVYLLPAAGGILFFTLISRFLRNIYDYKLFRIVTKLEDFFRNQGYKKYIRLHAGYHHGASSGQTIARIERGGVGLYAILNDIIGQNLFIPVVYFVAILGIFLVKNPLLALVVFLPLPMYLLLVRKWAAEVYTVDRSAHDQFERVDNLQHDVASNIMTVKHFCQEEAEIQNQEELRETAREIQYGAEKLWIKIDLLQTTLAAFGRAVVLCLAGWYVINSQVTVGEFMLYITLQGMVYAPMFQLSVLFPRLRRNLARAEGLFSVIDEPIEIVDAEGASELKPLAREILFDRVSFRYGEKQHRAIRNFTLRIPQGSKTALVGRSGSGKTTFVKLLGRIYDPQDGAILVDGVDIRTVTQNSLRSQMGSVSQEVDLFNRTILENIRYGRPEGTKKEVEEAAKLAFIHDFILEMPEGYETMVGERGIKLSGGQRQRVGIARAILKNPGIFILDESTNALDSESESIVKEATAAAMKGRTTIAIAHRLSTIKDADQIAVFDHGTLEALGTHEELLEISPIYRRLYEIQFKD